MRRQELNQVMNLITWFFNKIVMYKNNLIAWIITRNGFQTTSTLVVLLYSS